MPSKTPHVTSDFFPKVLSNISLRVPSQNRILARVSSKILLVLFWISPEVPARFFSGVISRVPARNTRAPFGIRQGVTLRIPPGDHHHHNYYLGVPPRILSRIFSRFFTEIPPGISVPGFLQKFL